MVKIAYEPIFKKRITKIRDSALKTKIKKQIAKIIQNPNVGKPMRFTRKGTREIYVKPFRLSYIYFERGETVVLLDIYHKDHQ
jgi:putative component of toxin-antitoxin plasmid stabilization module